MTEERDTSQRVVLFHLSRLGDIDKYIRCKSCNRVSVHDDYPLGEDPCPFCGAICYEIEYDEQADPSGIKFHGEPFFAEVPRLILRTLAALAPKEPEKTEAQQPERKRFFRLEPPPADERLAMDLGLIVFFCTLNEALLANTLKKVAALQGHGADLMARLLAGQTTYDRLRQLFKSVTGTAFGDVLKAINTDENNYQVLHEKVVDAMKLRHKLVHTGNVDEIPGDYVDGLLQSIEAILLMHVAVYNYYVR